MLFVPVPAFTHIPDGRIRVGPLRGPISRVRSSFMRYGLRLGTGPKDPVMVSRHTQGLVLSCAGDGVRGYMLDRENIEASSSDVDALMRRLLPDGAVCRVSGHYRSEETLMIESEALFWRVGAEILSSERREMIRTDGVRRLLSARSAGAPRLGFGRGEGRLMAV